MTLKKNASKVVSLLLAILPLSAISQRYTVVQNETSTEDYYHKLLPTGNNEFIDISYNLQRRGGGIGELNITRYNAQVKQVYKKAVKELSSKFEFGMVINNRLYLFAVDGQGGVTRYDWSEETGNVDARSKLFTIPGEYYRLSHGYSQDSNYCYIVCSSHNKKDDNETFTGIVIDRSLDNISTFTFKSPVNRNDITGTEFALDDNSTLSIVYGAKVKASKNDYTPTTYNICPVSKGGKINNVTLSGLPEGNFQNVAWYSKDGILSFAGLLAKTKKNGYTSILTGAFDTEHGKLIEIKESALANYPSVTGATASCVKRLADKGIPEDAFLLSSFMYDDNSRILLLEVNSYSVEQSYFAMSNTPSYSVTYNKTGNIYLVKINPKNELEWVHVIVKNQEEPDLRLYTGSVFLKTKTGLHIFFHDRTDNTEPETDKSIRIANVGEIKKHSLAAIYISLDGKMKKQFIVDDDQADFRLSPEKETVAFNNGLVFLGLKHKLLGAFNYVAGKILVDK